MAAPSDSSSIPPQPYTSSAELLPYPLFVNICSFLNANGRLKVKCVCRQWQEFVARYDRMQASQQPNNDIRETVLWSLYNRVSGTGEAGILHDPKAVEIYQSIDYDYEKSFGKPNNNMAIRSMLFDEAILEFWREHPDGTVVNLGEGLETQRYRLQDKKRKDATWITVDLPSGIFIREQFMVPDDTHIHVASSAVDVSVWAQKVPLGKPVLITAQGLFMYLPEAEVKSLFQSVAKWFPGSTLIFNAVSKFFSNRTMRGVQWTSDYTVPKMPFGVDRFDAPALFRSWVDDSLVVEEIPYPWEMTSGWRGYVGPLFKVPYLRAFAPKTIFRVTFPSARR